MRRRLALLTVAALLTGALVQFPAWAQAPVEIAFWYGVGGQLQKVIESQAEKFNRAHPGIRVSPFYAGAYGGGGPMQQKLLASIAAGSVPAVVQLEIHATCTFASKGALLPLDELMARSDHDRKDDFLAVLTNTDCDGKTYGIPFNRSVPILYYNRDRFAKAGLAGPPKTWTELATMAATLTRDEPGGKVYGFMPINQWWFFQSMTWSAGGDILAPDMKRAVFASEAGAAGLRVWADLIEHGSAQVRSGPTEFLQTIQDFVNEKTAMYWGSAADMGAVAAAKFDWRAALSPGFEGRRLVVPQGGANAVIMAKAPADQQKAAWEFVQWWTSPAEAAYWSRQTGYVPVVKRALDDPEFKTFLKANPNHAVAIDELAYSRAASPSPKYFQVLQLIQRAQQNIISNKAPAMDTLKAVAQQVDAVLASP
jgi:ABC-type glycerol-3-phosphate transport system substrate-binding protein